MYLSYNIVRVIKSRRLGWAGHVARMGEGRSDFEILTGTRPLGIDGMTILEWTLKKLVTVRAMGLIRLRIGIFGQLL